MPYSFRYNIYIYILYITLPPHLVLPFSCPPPPYPLVLPTALFPPACPFCLLQRPFLRDCASSPGLSHDPRQPVLTTTTHAGFSATGTRTRVARVRAEYPNQLDYSGYGPRVVQKFRGKPARTKTLHRKSSSPAEHLGAELFGELNSQERGLRRRRGFR